MAYLVFARKYRPQTFRQVIGQDHVTQTLANAVSSNRVAHAILFSGPRGTGKTTVARILAKAMNCVEGPTPTPCNVCSSCTDITAGHSADVFEIDGASNNSVDQIRELRDNIKYMPANSAHKIYIIDEVHMLSLAAFNALLKTLEEPPSHILFFFATTEPHKIPVTILSRCQRYDFRRIDTVAIADHLRSICANENVPMSDESLWVMAREAGGSMRDSLSLLDQVVACSHGEIDHGQVLNILGVFDTQELFAISDAVLEGDVSGLLLLLDTLYRNGKDLKKLYYDLMGHFRNLFVLKTAQQPENLVTLQPRDIEAAQTRLEQVSGTDLGQLIDLLAREEASIRFSTQPRIAMEMAFIRMARLKPVLPISTLIERLDSLREDIAKGHGFVDPPPNGGNIHENHVSFGATHTPGSGENVVASEMSARPAAVPKDNLNDAWQHMVNVIKEKHSSLAPNLAQSRLVDITGDKLTIEITGNAFNLARVKREKNMAILKKICSDYYGKEMRIHLQERAEKSEEHNHATKDEDHIKSEALNHPLVAEAVHLFDGKVVDVKIL